MIPFRKLKIANVKVPVKRFADDDNDGLYKDGIIYIAKGLQPKYEAEVLWHEIKHAIAYLYSIDEKDDEERTVSVQAMAEIKLWCENPKLLKYFTDVLG